jgi:transposase
MAESKDVIKQIRKATRRKFSADEKIRIVLEGLRGLTPISEICRREGIAVSVYYKWSKSFLEAGKNRLNKAILRYDNGEEVRGLKQENSDLKKAGAESVLEVQHYGRREEILEKRKQLKAKTILERKRISCKIIGTGAEIVS